MVYKWFRIKFAHESTNLNAMSVSWHDPYSKEHKATLNDISLEGVKKKQTKAPGIINSTMKRVQSKWKNEHHDQTRWQVNT
jgi:hypothetical protein